MAAWQNERLIERRPRRQDRRDTPQNKQQEIAFFDDHAEADDYNVFTPAAGARLIETFARLSALAPRARVVFQRIHDGSVSMANAGGSPRRRQPRGEIVREPAAQ